MESLQIQQQSIAKQQWEEAPWPVQHSDQWAGLNAVIPQTQNGQDNGSEGHHQFAQDSKW